MKYITPSVNETAFNCPHCGVLTTQYWFGTCAFQFKENQKPPVWHKDQVNNENLDVIQDNNQRDEIRKLLLQLAEGNPFFSNDSQDRWSQIIHNCWTSSCYECRRLSIWIHERLIYPALGKAPPVNPDAPDHIKTDYEEASTILDLSPRGAAALLRLAIQKLCIEFGQPGKNLNHDIHTLVSHGTINTMVQQMLDTVRVIGNEAVHPGVIDLRDDRHTAEMLFYIFNLIIEKAISEPKHVREVYAKLPGDKLDAITKRDEA